ncbi:RDD family protein [Bacillus sp. AGMB 02131]|uniref:RDD family protein n=1 Tax=Peribacillus faecalis TaxID=2772559 RepID=A0A927D0M8_9BACI|nr:RDD family protein [Peribacillus faecalis]MBD3110471.1 RDD family protein [Peribacillus faecalis]
MTGTNSNHSDQNAKSNQDELTVHSALPNNDEYYINQNKPDDETVEHVKSDDGAYAGFWLRFWAYLIDLVSIWSLDHLLVKPIFKMLNISQYDFEIFSPITIGSAIVFYLYFVLMTKYFGQTLGKMVLGIRVISLKDQSLSWGTVIFRELIGRFIVRTLMFGFTYILVGVLPKKQGLHDIFADTSVIQERSRAKV